MLRWYLLEKAFKPSPPPPPPPQKSVPIGNDVDVDADHHHHHPNRFVSFRFISSTINRISLKEKKNNCSALIFFSLFLLQPLNCYRMNFSMHLHISRSIRFRVSFCRNLQHHLLAHPDRDQIISRKRFLPQTFDLEQWMLLGLKRIETERILITWRSIESIEMLLCWEKLWKSCLDMIIFLVSLCHHYYYQYNYWLWKRNSIQDSNVNRYARWSANRIHSNIFVHSNIIVFIFIFFEQRTNKHWFIIRFHWDCLLKVYHKMILSVMMEMVLTKRERDFFNLFRWLLCISPSDLFIIEIFSFWFKSKKMFLDLELRWHSWFFSFDCLRKIEEIFFNRKNL